ncbi:hypothetical protein GIB67_040038 [Kingdonia uniflora]|uniref:Glycosyltransferase n=1 Tax=Kingdonia uniflora TaxID=39325 RepID=A0A7J7MUL7_9MAGN|nr:hypothetical protein GIB67_040038 [Kingdonia uniflora]
MLERKIKMGKEMKGHVLLLPFPAQGHFSPMLQFAKRLASKGLKATIAMTISVTKSSYAEAGGVQVEIISENGYTREGVHGSFKDVGSRVLLSIIEKNRYSSDAVTCIVYDSICPWALEVAKENGLFGASFFSQSCSVNYIFYQVSRGIIGLPVEETVSSIPGLPPLEISELPTFVSDLEVYKVALDLFLGQFSNLDKADSVVFNTFDKLESKVVKHMRKLWNVLTIGPAIPSMYLDKRMEGDKDYGLNLFEPSEDPYIKWLNARETGSVIYLSFGSIAVYTNEQMDEVANALRQSNKYFLWVVREEEMIKLPKNFIEETSDKGLVVTWCSQIEVLSHSSIGCFITHCGWNSILEALSLGVPMVTMPNFADQTTNAKFVADIWGAGIWPTADHKRIIKRDKLEASIRNVMEVDIADTIKKNISNFREMTRDAMEIGGSSFLNIENFVKSLQVVRK